MWLKGSGLVAEPASNASIFKSPLVKASIASLNTEQIWNIQWNLLVQYCKIGDCEDGKSGAETQEWSGEHFGPSLANYINNVDRVRILSCAAHIRLREAWGSCNNERKGVRQKQHWKLGSPWAGKRTDGLESEQLHLLVRLEYFGLSRTSRLSFLRDCRHSNPRIYGSLSWCSGQAYHTNTWIRTFDPWGCQHTTSIASPMLNE